MKHYIELAKLMIAENGLENFRYSHCCFGTKYPDYKQAKKFAIKYSVICPIQLVSSSKRDVRVMCYTSFPLPIGIIAERMKDPTRDFSDEIAEHFEISFVCRPREHNEFEFVDVYRDEFQYDAISDYMPYTAETIKTINTK